jgi:hypothetical protein
VLDCRGGMDCRVVRCIVYFLLQRIESRCGSKRRGGGTYKMVVLCRSKDVDSAEGEGTICV